MIHAVSANDARFKSVSLESGMNLLLADTTEASTETDTRNGLGKTLLVEIVHFCLGATAPAGNDGLGSPSLTGWSFTVDLSLGGARVAATRSLSEPGRVGVAGEFDDWPVVPVWDKEVSQYRLALADWKTVLGELMFGIDAAIHASEHGPTFRTLFPYFARVHTGAYATPFKFYAQQREVAKQVSVAYLLGLAWEDAAQFQRLKDQKEALNSLKRAIKIGALGEQATLGDLRAHRVRLRTQISKLEDQLQTFEVHPEYGQITQEANALTSEIHALVNTDVVRARKISSYVEQEQTEQGPDADAVVRLFEAAGVELSGSVKKTLEDAQAFHDGIVADRLNYLRDEMTALGLEAEASRESVERLSKRRAHLLEILESKHALEELNRLQGRLADQRAELADVEAQMARITEIDEREAVIRVQLAELERSSKREHAAREPRWTQAIELFAENTQVLYDSPGELVIDLDSTGFKFNVRIRGGGSRGVDSMKVFAFDLMLAELFAGRETGPGLLWHDSELFDGVDERQIAAALRLAHAKSNEHGFQYFCSMNSDDLPPSELLGDIPVEPVLRLTDTTDDGGLFGIRF